MEQELQWERMRADLKKRAGNNKDHQAFIHPSEYGYSELSEGTKTCIQHLKDFPEVKSVKQAGKNLLLVTVYEEE